MCIILNLAISVDYWCPWDEAKSLIYWRVLKIQLNHKTLVLPTQSTLNQIHTNVIEPSLQSFYKSVFSQILRILLNAKQGINNLPNSILFTLRTLRLRQTHTRYVHMHSNMHNSTSPYNNLTSAQQQTVVQKPTIVNHKHQCNIRQSCNNRY